MASRSFVDSRGTNISTYYHTGKVCPGKDIVIFMSHSGNTGESVAASRLFLARGVTTLVITGNKGML